MSLSSQNLFPPIRFGTDGWRGLIADDFTFARLGAVVPLAAQALAENFRVDSTSQKIIVGYDRRFLSPEFGRFTAEVLAKSGFDVDLTTGFAPTPAFSWAAYNQKALGALVITASHNPASYNGLKIKGAFGGSVSPDLTKQVEAKLESGLPVSDTLSEVASKKTSGKITIFDPWESYCQVLRSLVDIKKIQTAISSGTLTVFADPMYGAAAGGLAQILEVPIHEINSNSDPTFGGYAPEPLARNISALCRKIRAFNYAQPDHLAVGFVFDGDGDRIAAVDSQGNFLSSQILIPILISHLAQNRGFTGEVIKTISGLNLIPKVAKLYNLTVYETPIGYKYIAERMLSGIAKPLIGGEESGGIGYGTHIPERDALLSALYLMEAIATSNQDLSDIYKSLQQQTGYTSHYDRIDQHLASADASKEVLERLQPKPFNEIAHRKVIAINTIDGFKFELEDDSWLLIRFSGTEPVLRLYCEAQTPELVAHTLGWIRDWVHQK